MNRLILAIFLLNFISCTKDNLVLEDMLLKNSGLWEMQTLSIYQGGSISDNLNSQITSHYKNLGTLVFSEKDSSYFIFEEKRTPFEYTVNSNRLIIRIANSDVDDFSSSFLYYFFGGLNGNPFLETKDTVSNTYEMDIINSFTLQGSFEINGSSSFDINTALEFIITQ